MAYNGYQVDKPDGADNGPVVIADAKRNGLALRDAIVAGMMPGFAFSIVNGTGSDLFPQFLYWKQGVGASAPWLRATLVWGTTGSENGNVTTMTWAYSANGGSTWDDMAGASVLTYNGAGFLLSATNMAGGMSWLMALFGLWWRLYDRFTLHLIESNPHGIEDMAYQTSLDVAIEGGTITTAIQRVYVAASLGTKSAPFDIDLALGHVFDFTVAVGAVATFIGKPAAGTVHPFSLRITNGGLVADSTLFPGCHAPGGNLSLSSAGTDWLHGLIRDGSIIEFTGVSAAMAAL
jgi:hypothetical protein